MTKAEQMYKFIQDVTSAGYGAFVRRGDSYRYFFSINEKIYCGDWEDSIELAFDQNRYQYYEFYDGCGSKWETVEVYYPETKPLPVDMTVRLDGDTTLHKIIEYIGVDEYIINKDGYIAPKKEIIPVFTYKEEMTLEEALELVPEEAREVIKKALDK